MDKKTTRQLQLTKLKTINPLQKQQESHDIYQKLFNHVDFKMAKVIGITLSQAIEIDTTPIIEACFQQNKQVVIPKTLPQYEMAFYRYTNKTKLLKSRFGVFEPQVLQNEIGIIPDLMITPGLAFTSIGQRLGFGGGYYDRYLKKNPAIKTISLALTCQQLPVDSWPVETFDILIDNVLMA